MTGLVLETSCAKRGATEISEAVSFLRERAEEGGCAVLSDRATECTREGVLGTILGVGGCIDDRWPGFGVWAVLIERETDLEPGYRASPIERCWLTVSKPS